MIDHYTDMHRAADIRAYRAASRRALIAIAWAIVGALLMLAILHDAPARIAATVWQAEQGELR